jgi:23S rRNA (cytidine1920-2'-O)/16S rRNA (cytidine1409-2'-O)-methyltransferase
VSPPREKQRIKLTTTQRADMLLVERNIFDSRAKAQAAIAAGTVTANGLVVRKPSAAIPRDAALAATPAHPYVSRGGVKLAHALAQSGFSVADRVCLDVGASTGGFSQVLLAQGALRIYAIDVGTAQLHASLHDNSKIVSMENTDIRQVTPAALAETPDFAVIDVSFISLRHVIPATLALLSRPAEMIALIKPQFEVTRGDLKRGVVRDSAVHARVCAEIAAFVAALGCDILAQFPSPIAGGDGNREFFIAARCR